ncbi:MAG: methionine gamma-lyase family protein [Clostridia bacterium]|nr:methionine gamma-lyase family protein [Clostridia bacterium]
MNVEMQIKRAEEALAKQFARVDEIALFNQEKVLTAFQREQIALRHFLPSTGYGYGDEGRDTLARVYAYAFGAERAIVSPAILSGTHALTVALFGVLRPGDKILFLTGEPYDTLRGVVWGEGNGSLKDFGVKTDVLPLTAEGKVDFSAAKEMLCHAEYRMVYIQRSRGYEVRDAFTVAEIGKMCAFVRENGFGGCIFVDNCYGEFVEKSEPTQVGADLIVGSLIKNPGGGLAPTGGYIAGKEHYVLQCENRLTAPSVGGEIGSYAYGYQQFYQGFFLAPHVVAQALKGGLLIGKCMEALGYENFPATHVPLADITRAIRFNTDRELIAFIQSVQEVSPVDSFVKLEPWDMPGYDSKVIMAAGTFVAGASIELSADAPVRAPYIAYFQGGLTYEHCKIACRKILERLTSER